MMATLLFGSTEVDSIFQLLGDKENDITKSIAWALTRCPKFMELFIYELANVNVDADKVTVRYQSYEEKKGITDLEITDDANFYIIVEAKRGWILPGKQQLEMYADRSDFKNSQVKTKLIVTMSECSNVFATNYLPVQNINGIPVKHLSWKRLYKLMADANADSNHQQKHLLEELKIYLRGIMTMQQKYSNLVYVVSLSRTVADGATISYLDVVKKKNKYFFPIGNNWPKEPPNYIGFRYDGQLQSIHHVESYVVTKNLHTEIAEMPDIEELSYFVLDLGPAILPPKQVKNGQIHPMSRVWAMLDTLLTEDTVADAVSVTQGR